MALALALSLAGCGDSARKPLWPGSKYTEADRDRAIRKALLFIEHSADDPRNFAQFGSDYLFCFSSIAAAATDPTLPLEANRFGRILANRWAIENSADRVGELPPAKRTADAIADLVGGWYGATLLNADDTDVKPILRAAAAKFGPLDYLGFDPAQGPPPDGLPDAKGKPRSKYSVWLDALITTYQGDAYGVRLGADYRNVVRWLPRMRPYRAPDGGWRWEFLDVVYTLTHLVYTLNDYGVHRVPKAALEPEYQYLHENLPRAIQLEDPETMGEFLDTLKAFGATMDDPMIRLGTAYLLDTQRPDGTWSAPGETDAYTLYHSAWTGIGGLMGSRWQGYGPAVSLLAAPGMSGSTNR
jgi:hypothetical protein